LLIYLTNLLKAMLSFNPYIIDQPYTSHEEGVTTFGEFMHIIPHDLLSYDLLWAHTCDI
jgi:hypothetical protein